MVIVDGRTDVEKLKELLATGTECNELEFKEMLDLTKMYRPPKVRPKSND